MKRSFLYGFLIGLLLFVVVNLVAAQVLSDCGLISVFGRDACADDIARAGFPLVFFEEGGFVYRHIFNMPYFLLDIFIGFDFAIISGFAGRYITAKRMV